MEKFETKWNWGAFIDPLGFAVGNKAYLCLLSFIPIFGFVWVFICGFKAEQWAYENKKNNYRDEEEFRKIMDTWKSSGLIKFIISTVITILYLFMFFLFLPFLIMSTINDNPSTHVGDNSHYQRNSGDYEDGYDDGYYDGYEDGYDESNDDESNDSNDEDPVGSKIQEHENSFLFSEL